MRVEIRFKATILNEPEGKVEQMAPKERGIDKENYVREKVETGKGKGEKREAPLSQDLNLSPYPSSLLVLKGRLYISYTWITAPQTYLVSSVGCSLIFHGA